MRFDIIRTDRIVPNTNGHTVYDVTQHTHRWLMFIINDAECPHNSEYFTLLGAKINLSLSNMYPKLDVQSNGMVLFAHVPPSHSTPAKLLLNKTNADKTLMLFVKPFKEYHSTCEITIFIF